MPRTDAALLDWLERHLRDPRSVIQFMVGRRVGGDVYVGRRDHRIPGGSPGWHAELDRAVSRPTLREALDAAVDEYGEEVE